jgi:L-ribulose-5-phosphate 3-epimerase
MPALNRRDFVTLSGTAIAGVATVGFSAIVRAAEPPIRLKKAVKYSMVKPGAEPGAKRSAPTTASVLERFQLIAECGFPGCEIDSPGGPDPEEARDAAAKTGVKIHGVIDSVHWQKRFSSPDRAILDEAHEALKTAIAACKTVGGSTVLVVPASLRKGHDEIPLEEAWDRSIAEIKRCVPLAKEAGVKIAIETVWNEFITTPEQFVKYIDAFGDSTVGGYFDVSNMLKYGVSSADWIRQTGKRLLKVDCKGYSIGRKAFGEIGTGDEDWPNVLKALKDVNYPGEFMTAEVGGGGKERLLEISRQLDQVLQLV